MREIPRRMTRGATTVSQTGCVQLSCCDGWADDACDALSSLHFTLRDGPWRLCSCRSFVCCAQATTLSTWLAGVDACMWLCECWHSQGMRQTRHSPHAESAHIHTHAVDEAAAQRARLGGSSSPRSSYYFVKKVLVQDRAESTSTTRTSMRASHRPYGRVHPRMPRTAVLPCSVT